MLDRLMLLLAPLVFAFFLSMGVWEARASRAPIVHPAVVVEVTRDVTARAAVRPSDTGAAPCTHGGSHGRSWPAARVS